MNANKKSNLIAIFTIAAFLPGTLAFAASDVNSAPQKPSPQEKAVNKDFSKVSADGSGAFMDLTLTRLAVFEGRIDAAKKYIDKADKALARAKTDEARFLKAEADFKAGSTNTKSTDHAQQRRNDCGPGKPTERSQQ